MSTVWNPWHGCHKLSEGCLNCYVYRIDGKFERNSSDVTLNADYDLPIRKKRSGEWAVPPGETVYTCLSSDFFIENADDWRPGAWEYMKMRPDLQFVIITKRIVRFGIGLPDDWGSGYDNVTICCTCENARRASERLPFFLKFPIKHRQIICEPMLEYVDFSRWLSTGKVEEISVGGESGDNARVCDYEWVEKTAMDARRAEVRFRYHQTGSKLLKNGRTFEIPRNLQESQARKAGLDT